MINFAILKQKFNLLPHSYSITQVIIILMRYFHNFHLTLNIFCFQNILILFH